MIGKILKIIGAIVVLCVALSVITAVINPDSATKPAPTRTPEAIEVIETPVPVPTVTPPNPIETAVRKVCGDGLIAMSGDANQISVDCRLKRGLTDGGVMIGAGIDIYDMTRGVFTVADTQAIQFRLISDFKDKFGNVSQAQAMGVRIPRALYAKINWQNFYPRDLGNLIESGEDGAVVVLHPYWRSAWIDWLKG